MKRFKHISGFLKVSNFDNEDKTDKMSFLKKKKREFNGTLTHLLDGYISANQIIFLHY